jgi:hypothetical protein
MCVAHSNLKCKLFLASRPELGCIPPFSNIRKLSHRGDDIVKPTIHLRLVSQRILECVEFYLMSVMESVTRNTLFSFNRKSMSLSRRGTLPSAVPWLPNGLRASTPHSHVQECDHHSKLNFLVLLQSSLLFFCARNRFRNPKFIDPGELPLNVSKKYPIKVKCNTHSLTTPIN